jgi:CheY-like chemotaxis protein
MATVLIADDDWSTRSLVCTVLEHVGHRVIEARDGLEALEKAAAEALDLVLLDLSMPSMSGPAFLRALRAEPKTKATAVALYTATPIDAALRDFMEMYAIREAVPKPCEPAELIAAVERALA